MNKVKFIKIADKKVGNNKPVFIIAEAGVNHNGSLKNALKLVDVAAKARANAIKFQTFKAEDVVTAAGQMAAYQRKNIGKPASQFDMLKKLELKENFYKAIIQYCRKRKIIFLSTPHGSFNSVNFLHSLNVSAFKFGSGDLTNLPLLQHAAKFRKPIILGTGMATLTEVKQAIRCIENKGNKQIIILHCTTNYPCPLNEVNLRAMKMISERLNVLAGYSDHTLGTQVPVMAVSMGACVIEKHFTLDKTMPGPDHRASLNHFELRTMVDQIRKAEMILGSEVKKPSKSEIPMIKTVRKSLVALIDINKGEQFNERNLGIKRPGVGLPPRDYQAVLGKKAKRYIKADRLIRKKDYL